MSSLVKSFKFRLDKAFRRLRVRKNKNFQIQNKNISIIASNCTGGVLAHDLNIGFNSPFVNLWMKPDDYLRMLNVSVKAEGV